MLTSKPTWPKVFGKEAIGTIEEVVRDSRLVDKGIKELKKLSANAPSFDPERRRFLKHVAVLAGLIASGQLLKACSTIQEPVVFQGKTYSNWEAWLLSQDLVRGPGLLIVPHGGPYPAGEGDAKRHLITQGRYAVDYDVPIGTPIMPTANAFRTIDSSEHTGGIVLELYHRYGREGYKSMYAHLSRIADIIGNGTPWVSPVTGIQYRDQPLHKSQIVAFSGNSGRKGSGPQPEHLHFEILRIINKKFELPGIDPFQAGIDANKPVSEYGGRPVYWDGNTEIFYTLGQIKGFTQWLGTLEARIKESDLDKATKEELLKRRSNLREFRDYIGMRVMQKKPSAPDGKPRYEFMPGSFMYALMLETYNRLKDTRLEFTAMLPFIFPPLKPVYQKANPGVQF